MKYFSFLLSIIILGTNCRSHVENAKDPNIIIILADDMGYGDVQTLNETSKIPTPNFNRLAAEGVTFTDAHTPSAVCTPTRYGLLTGRYCWRSSLKSGVLNGYGKPLIETHRSTIASLLKQKGYQTGVVGKWHLGLGFQKDTSGAFDFSKSLSYSPNDVGFDYSYIIPASLDFPPYIYVENKKITEYPSLEQVANKFPAYWRKGERSPKFIMEETLDHLVEKANEYISEQAAKDPPFLLYLPLTAPHKPVLPHQRFRGKTELGDYGDFVYQVDYTVGQVLNKLDELKLTNNTIVIYTSDNGSFMHRYQPNEMDHVDDGTIQAFAVNHHMANYVFRGTKADIWEAGHHVPFFIRWPGKLGGGYQIDSVVCLTDIYATLAEIITMSKPVQSAEDSYSFLPLLEKRDVDYSRAPVIHHSAAGMFAIRKGDWKLILGDGSGGRERPRGKRFQQPYKLFDLKADVGETNNLIARYPKVAAELEKTCLEIIGDDL